MHVNASQNSLTQYFHKLCCSKNSFALQLLSMYNMRSFCYHRLVLSINFCCFTLTCRYPWIDSLLQAFFVQCTVVSCLSWHSQWLLPEDTPQDPLSYTGSRPERKQGIGHGGQSRGQPRQPDGSVHSVLLAQPEADNVLPGWQEQANPAPRCVSSKWNLRQAS